METMLKNVLGPSAPQQWQTGLAVKADTMVEKSAACAFFALVASSNLAAAILCGCGWMLSFWPSWNDLLIQLIGPLSYVPRTILKSLLSAMQQPFWIAATIPLIVVAGVAHWKTTQLMVQDRETSQVAYRGVLGRWVRQMLLVSCSLAVAAIVLVSVAAAPVTMAVAGLIFDVKTSDGSLLWLLTNSLAVLLLLLQVRLMSALAGANNRSAKLSTRSALADLVLAIIWLAVVNCAVWMVVLGASWGIAVMLFSFFASTLAAAFMIAVSGRWRWRQAARADQSAVVASGHTDP